MKWLILLFLILAVPAHADSDTWGNEYPPECSVEALEKVYLPVLEQPQAIIDQACKSHGRVGCFTKTGYALVLPDLDADVLADVVRHEKCHKAAGEWHGAN